MDYNSIDVVHDVISLLLYSHLLYVNHHTFIINLIFSSLVIWNLSPWLSTYRKRRCILSKHLSNLRSKP